MKVKSLALLAGLGSLLVAGTANADFVGLAVHHVGAVDLAPDSLGGGAFQGHTWHVVAQFDAEGGGVQAVAGYGDVVLSTTIIGSVFNHPAGANLPPSQFLVNLPGSTLGSDSFVTIGATTIEAANNLALAPGTGTLLGGLSGSFEFSGANEGAWFTAPTDPNAAAVFNADSGRWEVLLFQLTLSADGYAEGSWNVQTLDGVLHTDLFWAIPSPGALALLGVAGLFGVRRRRA